MARSLRPRTDPLPVALIADLLAIARLLRLQLKHEAAPAYLLRAVEAAGRQLRGALQLAGAAICSPDHARAWALAEAGARALGAVVSAEARVADLVGTARRGMRRRLA